MFLISNYSMQNTFHIIFLLFFSNLFYQLQYIFTYNEQLYELFLSTHSNYSFLQTADLNKLCCNIY